MAGFSSILRQSVSVEASNFFHTHNIPQVFKLMTLKLFMYLLLIFLPLIGSFCAGLFGRKLGPFGASYITVSCLVLAFFISLFAFYEVALLNCCVYVKLAP